MKIKESFEKINMPDDFKEAARSNILREANSLRQQEKNKTSKHGWKYITSIATAAAAICVLLVAVTMPGLSQSPKSTAAIPPVSSEQNTVIETVGTKVLLSINPKIEFNVDASAMIISVSGKNEDGAALIDGIDFSGFSFENPTILVVNKLIEKGYISVASVDEHIYLSVSGEENDADLLEVMSATIKAAASEYEIKVDAVKKDETEVQIVLAEDDSRELDENALPDADPVALPAYMEIEYELTGKVNSPEDIGWRGEGEDRVFQHGYSEVNDVYLTLEDGKRFNASQIVEFDTAGDWLSTSIMQVMHSLIEKGYITSGMPGQIVIKISGCTQKQYADTKELISMMLQEAGLSLDVKEENGSDTLIIVPSSTTVTREPSEYTLSDLLNIKFNKDLDKITKLQMNIMKMAFTEDGAEERLEHRYWAVIPNCIGLSEEAAVKLCELNGFKPNIVYEEFIEGESLTENIGKVFYQDMPAGYTDLVGMRVQLNIQTDNETREIKDNAGICIGG